MELLASPDLVRNLVLAVALVATAGAATWRASRGDLAGRTPAVALATLAVWVAVLAVEQATDLWTFREAPTTVAGMPLEVSLGWALLWGAVPTLLGGPLWAWLVGFAWVDVVAMPLLTPLVTLDDGWLVGEALLLVAAAAPGLVLGRATVERRWLPARVVLQAALFTGLFGWLLPHLALEVDGLAWGDVVDHPYLVRSALLTAAVLLGVPALAAVVELARAGGTPFPWDPPSRLVTTGPYAYLANPMQLGAAGLLGLLALAAGSVTLAVGTAFCVAFSVVLAERHERATLTDRWPAYGTYRRHVRAWWPRWRPYVPTPATLWVSDTCPLCAATGAMVETLEPTGLVRRAAEGAPEPLRRMRWDDGTSTSSGVAAFARALEHSTLPLAWLGWWMRLPGVDRVLQLVGDAVGLGPRTLPTTPGER